jgi:23S rRNA (adenine2503-C2)-methyltransferase
MTSEGRTDIAGVTEADLAAWLERHGEARYRTGQILAWVNRRSIGSFDEMTDVGHALRRRLAAEFSMGNLELESIETSSDGTRKLLSRLPGPAERGAVRIESVLIPRLEPGGHTAGRLTLCVSTQAGCGMGCAFCATATLGLLRNLTAGEIVGQFHAARRVATPHAVTNVVFMGMGEPLANWPALRRALDILTATWGAGLSRRRITVSTVGLAPLIPTVVDETGVNLAISLHATTDAQRRRLMPIAGRYGLSELVDACRRVAVARRDRITFEYVLLAGENDTDADARRLGRLLHGVRAKVNLIRFNPYPGARFAPTPPERVAAFRRTLIDRGLATTVRESRGSDIQAACGQLAAGRRAA